MLDHGNRISLTVALAGLPVVAAASAPVFDTAVGYPAPSGAYGSAVLGMSFATFVLSEAAL